MSEFSNTDTFDPNMRPTHAAVPDASSVEYETYFSTIWAQDPQSDLLLKDIFWKRYYNILEAQGHGAPRASWRDFCYVLSKFTSIKSQTEVNEDWIYGILHQDRLQEFFKTFACSSFCKAMIAVFAIDSLISTEAQEELFECQHNQCSKVFPTEAAASAHSRLCEKNQMKQPKVKEDSWAKEDKQTLADQKYIFNLVRSRLSG